MAKKTSASPEDDIPEISHVDKLLSELSQKFGNGIAIGANVFLDRPRQVISVSPALDIALGGGVPEGSWVTLTGAPKCGKTVTALHIAAKAQRPEFGGRHVFYLNAEGRLKPMNFEGIPGFDLNKFTVIESTQEKLLSVNDFLNIGINILKTVPGCVLIVDSLSALVPEKELIEGVGTSTRGGAAHALSQFCSQCGLIIPTMNNILIGITHIMANTSGYGAPTMEKGGYGIQYQVDVKLQAKAVEAWPKTGKQFGQKVTWITRCTALGQPPGTSVESYIRYGIGIDEIAELIQLGKDCNIVVGSSWLTCKAIDENDKWNGQEVLAKYLKDNPEKQTALRNAIMTALGR